jgi:hypothetical protein
MTPPTSEANWRGRKTRNTDTAGRITTAGQRLMVSEVNATAKTVVSLRIDERLLHDVEDIAEKEERTKSAVMLRLIRLGVESWKRKAAK